MEHIHLIEKEDLQQDRAKLRSFHKEIQMTSNINTYKEIQARVNEYLNNNKNLTQKEVDNFVDFLNQCSKFYNI